MELNRFQWSLERHVLNLETQSEGRIWAYTLFSPIVGLLVLVVGVIGLAGQEKYTSMWLILVIGLVALILALYSRLRVVLPIINGWHPQKWNNVMRVLKIEKPLSGRAMTYIKEIEDD